MKKNGNEENLLGVNDSQGYTTVEQLRYSKTQFPHGPGPSKALVAAFAAYDAISQLQEEVASGKHHGMEDVRSILAHEFEPTPANEAFVAVLTAAVEAAQVK